MSGQPGSFQPRGEDWIGREIQEIKAKIQRLEAANVFGLTGIVPKDGGTDLDGFVNINGPLTVNGDSAINGAMSINGPLILQPGSIENDSLANPMVTETSSNFLNNYAVGTTSTVRASVTLVVPDGFTTAVIMTNPTGMAQNSTATVDYLYVQAVVDGVNGGELYTSAGPGLAVGIASPFHTTIYALTGGQEIVVSVATRTGFATWAASTANQANLYVTALYFR